MSFTEKYRPRVVDDLVGQDKAQKDVRAFLRTGNIPQAILISGDMSAGKTTTAKIIAKAALCMKPVEGSGNPCGTCTSCKDFDTDSNRDFKEADAATDRGIDSIRELATSIQNLPMMSKRRVVFLDEAHGLTKVASEALLKSIEKPRPHVMFIFATTNPEKIPETVRGRCTQLRLKPISAQACASILKRAADAEKMTEAGVTDQHLLALAQACQGHPRNALHALEQVSNLLDDASDNGQAIDDAILNSFIEEAVRSDLGAASMGFVQAILAGEMGNALGYLDGHRHDLEVFFPIVLETFRQSCRFAAAPKRSNESYLPLADVGLLRLMKEHKGKDPAKAAAKAIIDIYGLFCDLRVHTSGYTVSLADLVDSYAYRAVAMTREPQRLAKEVALALAFSGVVAPVVSQPTPTQAESNTSVPSTDTATASQGGTPKLEIRNKVRTPA